jgi:hypothetical protein
VFKALETEWDFEPDNLIKKNQIVLSVVGKCYGIRLRSGPPDGLRPFRVVT